MKPLVETSTVESIMTGFAFQIRHGMCFHTQNTVTHGTRLHTIKFFIYILLPKEKSIEDTSILAV
jgi:hypothetical protein